MLHTQRVTKYSLEIWDMIDQHDLLPRLDK